MNSGAIDAPAKAPTKRSPAIEGHIMRSEVSSRSTDVLLENWTVMKQKLILLLQTCSDEVLQHVRKRVDQRYLIAKVKASTDDH